MKRNLILAMMAMTMVAMTGCGSQKADDLQEIQTDMTEQAPSQEQANKTGGTELAEQTEEKQTDDVQIPNPFVDCASFEEAAKLAGFDFTAPDLVEGYERYTISAVENELAQIIYYNEDSISQADDETLNKTDWETVDFSSHDVLIRKGKGTDDISGDYNTYDETSVLTVGDRSVTVRSSDGKIYVATWTEQEYSYAIDTSDGMTEKEITALVEKVK